MLEVSPSNRRLCKWLACPSFSKIEGDDLDEDLNEKKSYLRTLLRAMPMRTGWNEDDLDADGVLKRRLMSTTFNSDSSASPKIFDMPPSKPLVNTQHWKKRGKSGMNLKDRVPWF